KTATGDNGYFGRKSFHVVAPCWVGGIALTVLLLHLVAEMPWPGGYSSLCRQHSQTRSFFQPLKKIFIL
ncbi:hypothetical protein, partial [Pseudomonas gingeri]|uniref:hypothetical protein n=1 Tax=Pseudomonas gingeri TaxID=117681 RepID=UPI001AE09B82